jgi:hypothetical protein
MSASPPVHLIESVSPAIAWSVVSLAELLETEMFTSWSPSRSVPSAHSGRSASTAFATEPETWLALIFPVIVCAVLALVAVWALCAVWALTALTALTALVALAALVALSACSAVRAAGTLGKPAKSRSPPVIV